MNLFSFPEELILTILSFTTNNITSLSLVCRFFATHIIPLRINKVNTIQLQSLFKRFNDMIVCKNPIYGKDEGQLKLTTLFLCDISNYVKIDFNRLTNLQKLSIYADIYGLKISLFTNLTTLSLSYTSTLYDNFKHLTNITKLKLNSCKNMNINTMLLTNLTHLKLGFDIKINNDSLTVLTKLTKLSLTTDDITDDGLEHLTQLTKLKLESNYKITNHCLTKLTNLNYLSLHDNHCITDDGLSRLTYLQKLKLEDNEYITSRGISDLINLKSLNLAGSNIIGNKDLSNLTNLTWLNLDGNDRIKDKGLTNLINLETVNFSNTVNIRCLKYLSKITTLDISYSDICDINHLNLTSLDISYNDSVTNEDLMLMTNLTSLALSSNNNITILTHLTNLRSLNLVNNYTITFETIKKLSQLQVLKINQSFDYSEIEQYCPNLIKIVKWKKIKY